MVSINDVSLRIESICEGHDGKKRYSGNILIQRKSVGTFKENKWNDDVDVNFFNEKEKKEADERTMTYFDKFGFSKYKEVKGSLSHLIRLIIILTGAERAFINSAGLSAPIILVYDQLRISCHLTTNNEGAMRAMDSLLKKSASSGDKVLYALVFRKGEDFEIK